MSDTFAFNEIVLAVSQTSHHKTRNFFSVIHLLGIPIADVGGYRAAIYTRVTRLIVSTLPETQLHTDVVYAILKYITVNCWIANEKKTSKLLYECCSIRFVVMLVRR